MKIETNDQTIFGNTKPDAGFTIAGNAMAFQILSSGIYKHKIRAVVRELVCNCVDAHMINNQTKPFIVTAPNSLNQTFSVRDFGPGLSEKQMYEVYVQYFNSTKTENEIGGFGLGAKSPFSYTDTFSVKSFHKGKLDVYNMYIDNGSPKIAKTFSGAYEEGDEDGVEVIVPIKSEDESKWLYEIAHIMRTFKKDTYVIHGRFMEVDTFVDDEVFSSNTNDSKINAIYGNIVYPITLPVNTTWLTKTYGNLFVRFEMNTLRPQPSREELQHDEMTVKTIQDKFLLLGKDNKQKVLNDLSTMKGHRNIVRYLNSLSTNKVEDLKASSVVIDGESILEYTKGMTINSSLLDVIQKNALVYTKSANTLKSKHVRDGSYYSSSINARNIFDYNNKKVYILVIDVEKNIRQYIHSIFDHLKVQYLTVVNKDNDVNAVKSEYEKVMKDDEVVVIKASDYEDVRLAMFPKKERKKVDRPTTPTAYEYVISNDGVKVNALYLNSSDVANLCGYVVGSYKDKIVVKSDEFVHIASDYVHDVVSLCKRFGINKFYMIRPIYHKATLKNDNLVCLIEEFIERFVSNKFEVKNYKFTASKLVDKLRVKGLNELYSSVNPNLTDDEYAYYEILYMLKCFAISKTDNSTKVQNMLSEYKIKSDESKTNADKIVSELIEKFPLLEMYLESSIYRERYAKHITQLLKTQ